MRQPASTIRRARCFPLPSLLIGLTVLLVGCASESIDPLKAKPDVARSASVSEEAVQLDQKQMQPMYQELLAIDLPTVVKVATAQNVDILEARERVNEARGRYEGNVESIFPIISPSLSISHLSGVNQAVTGQLVPSHFTILNPAIVIQFLLNPGQVVYEIIASKKRLLGAQQQEQFVILDTLRNAVTEYYDLVYTRVKVSVAEHAIAEAEELLRLTNLRYKNGNALLVDVERAKTSLASRQQDLINATNAFYQTSVSLAVTLQLDPKTTLAPKDGDVPMKVLVRDDLGIDEMMALAKTWRPDLKRAESLANAAGADTKSIIWSGVGPQVQAGYQVGGLESHTSNQSQDMEEQRRSTASIGMNLSLSTLGRTKTANAVQQEAILELQKKLEIARADVIRTSQESSTQAKLAPVARQQLESAAETLRLANLNYKAGKALTIDVLQAEDALNEASQHYANAVINYNKAQVNLLAALGLLDKEKIAGN